ncbi:MAG: NAD(P)-dependent oxidoreductase [Ardenticatenia bacterium]|jgi:3-oxoacyl-[acyl-carrier protein] reductase|nr:MAG: NAD(P)-dependent oxidoreductase [Ardenticatenia bacterium]
MHSDELAGRVAVVTGAARGIGLAIAQALIEHGAAMALWDVDAPALEQAAHALGEAAWPCVVDVTIADAVHTAVRQVVDRFGALHILVNNAGICPMTPFEQISEPEWERVLAVNLKGAFLCCQAAWPFLCDAGPRGRIINISSVAGQMGGVSVGVHYAASKAGLIGLTKALAHRLAPYGVTVNCVAPGTTATEMTAAWSREDLERAWARIPLGRLAQPDEIAAAVCYLASDRAAFITGATLDINGGLYVR